MEKENGLVLRTLYAGWDDIDWNGHMKNVAFLAKASDVRMMYLSEQGFGAAEFRSFRLGPVVRRDQLEYCKEIKLLEEFVVRLWVAAMSDDGSRYRICNEFFRKDGTLLARVTSDGGWMALDTRRLTAPPPTLRQAFERLRTGEGSSAPECSTNGDFVQGQSDREL